MKKNNLLKLLLTSVISICMVLAFAGCGDSSSSSSDEETTEAETTVEAAEETAAASGDYDIAQGLTVTEDGDFAVLTGNGFKLSMPNTGTWSYKTFNENDTPSLEIYYMPAEEADFGGTLVTIMAMDLDDTTYEEFPSYAIAGESKALGKRFIALFTTDVQYDPNDETQAAEYLDLMHYVQGINATNAGSPFQVTE